MNRAMVVLVAVGIACATPAAPMSPAAAIGTDSSVSASAPAKGTLRVKLSGSGRYTVIGKKYRKSARASKKFKLKVGKYRVKAPGATVKPAGKVRVRKGKTVLVKVRFPVLGPDIQRISTDASGGQADAMSYYPAWSPDGTRVAFHSDAANLVPGDTNGARDVFVKTLATGAIERISTDSAGAQADAGSGQPAWSPDSTRLAFVSSASNLVPGDNNHADDVFVKNLTTGSVQRASTPPNGSDATNGGVSAAWAPDGNRLAFSSRSWNLVPGDSNGDSDVFVKDLAGGQVQRISTTSAGQQADSFSGQPAWSPDGTAIAFQSSASNLAAGDTNLATDVFTKDLATGVVRRVSPDAADAQGAWGAAWSPDSKRIAFVSMGDVFVKDLGTDAISRVGVDNARASGEGLPPQWSPDGTRIAFTWLLNGNANVYAVNLGGGTPRLVSSDAAGYPGNLSSESPSWSPDGKHIAFASVATNLVAGDTNLAYDVFVKRLK